MDEWVLNAKEVSATHPLSFEKADRENVLRPHRQELAMPDENLPFPEADTSALSPDVVRRDSLRGDAGRTGDIKHWAFNDPPKRKGKHKDAPPSPEEYRALTTRVVDLHPITSRRTRARPRWKHRAGPDAGDHRGPLETWRAEKVSIWQAGKHDNPFACA